MDVIVPLPSEQPAEDSRRWAAQSANVPADQLRLVKSTSTGRLVTGDGQWYDIDGTGLTFHRWRSDDGRD